MDSITKNDAFYFHEIKKGSPADEKLSTTTTPGKEDESELEGCRNNVQPTEEDKSVKNNVTDKKQNKINSSLVQWESDDPRKGGKICLEKLVDGNAKGIDTTYKERSLSKKRIVDDTSHMQMEEPNSEKMRNFHF